MCVEFTSSASKACGFLQLLNCYYEAYQHAAGAEQRFTLAQVITDIMHHRPPLDPDQDYFVQAYRTEISCLHLHRQLIKDILDKQVTTRVCKGLNSCSVGLRLREVLLFDFSS